MVKNNIVATSNKLAWFLIRSQPKREHIAVANLCKVHGVDSFCPRIRYKKATRRGSVNWIESMFPGYFFAKMNYEKQSREVTYASGVSHIVKFGDYAPQIATHIIEQLQESFSDGSYIMDVDPNIALGDEVEIGSGVLKGELGQVVKVLPGEQRVSILIEFMGDQKEIDVNLYDLILPK